MPTKNPELIHRNPSRLFANGWVGLEECRGCLFKALCLENEKNPTIRYLILGDEEKEQSEMERRKALRDCAL